MEPRGEAGLTSITWGQTQIPKGKGLLGCCEEKLWMHTLSPPPPLAVPTKCFLAGKTLQQPWLPEAIQLGNLPHQMKRSISISQFICVWPLCFLVPALLAPSVFRTHSH